MPDIPSIGHNSVGPAHRVAGGAPAPGTAKPKRLAEPRADQVELSDHVRLLDRLREMPNVRTELVNAVKQAIADGTYDTPDKLDTAVARMLDDLRS